jgi:hypothetical protein
MDTEKPMYIRNILYIEGSAREYGEETIKLVFGVWREDGRGFLEGGTFKINVLMNFFFNSKLRENTAQRIIFRLKFCLIYQFKQNTEL